MLLFLLQKPKNCLPTTSRFEPKQAQIIEIEKVLLFGTIRTIQTDCNNRQTNEQEEKIKAYLKKLQNFRQT